jgi:hypothetical protein
VAVEEVYDTGGYETVYNLRVADFHTYFVGSDEWRFSVWAHNAACIEASAPAAKDIDPDLQKRFEAYKAWKSKHGFDVGEKPTLPEFRRFMGEHVDWYDVNPGKITYGPLDEFARPTWALAELTPYTPFGSPASRSILPPGFQTGKGSNRARGHILADINGGSGKTEANLFTMEQTPANIAQRDLVDLPIYRATSSGQNVTVLADLQYNFNRRIPRGLTVEAEGSGGFSLATTILNPPGLWR